MNYIWVLIIVISIVCSFVTGKAEGLSTVALNGAQEAVQLLFSMVGMMCFWSGIMAIAEKSGLTELFAKIISPVVKRLFKDLDKNGKAMKAICMNIIANLLGLGNAATPFGLMAMKEMSKEHTLRERDTASNSMAMFVVINTASLQIIPTMMLSLRINHGSSQPFEVLPFIWLSSVVALGVGITVAKILERRE